MFQRAYLPGELHAVQARLRAADVVLTDQLERQIEEVVLDGWLGPDLRAAHPISRLRLRDLVHRRHRRRPQRGW